MENKEIIDFRKLMGSRFNTHVQRSKRVAI